LEQSIYWYKKAFENGCEKAKNELVILEKQLERRRRSLQLPK
ncbi:3502_t:CDS:1, partial [Acaulospora morrowiae]